MTFLFQGQDAFAERCERYSQHPEEFEHLKAERTQCTVDGANALKASDLAEDVYRSAIQGMQEIEARAQAKVSRKQEQAARGMEENLLNPGFNAPECAEALARIDRDIAFDRNSVTFARVHLIPSFEAKVKRAFATATAHFANLEYLDAVIAGIESMEILGRLAEIDGTAVFATAGSRTEKLYEQARRSYQTAVSAHQEAHEAERKAEALAQSGGVL